MQYGKTAFPDGMEASIYCALILREPSGGQVCSSRSGGHYGQVDDSGLRGVVVERLAERPIGAT
ncbi:hypothetical protein GJ744_010131 [Endocarpon pusillum]|uniref:Uncharacterized protein n=1 Tax=Endocarpon pusillum TaxID=364733 RepID=A0A8H7E370_9EURO|nr:hypothetical protein GJ744_010131 [Endocarpon pusillum]